MKTFLEISKYVLFSLLFIIITISCSVEKNQDEETQFNSINLQNFGNLLNQDLELLSTNKSTGKGINEDAFISSVTEILSDEPEQINDFEITFDYYYNNYNLILNNENSLNSMQNNLMSNIESRILETKNIDEAINVMTEEFEIISNTLMSNQDKEVVLLNIVLFREYFVFAKSNPEVMYSYDNSGKGGWWDCFKRTSGKKIGRGMAWGALSGALGGAVIGGAGGSIALPGLGTSAGAVAGGVYGGARGAVLGAIGGALWAAADCI